MKTPTLTLATADRILFDYVTPAASEIIMEDVEFVDPYGMVLLLCLSREAKLYDTRTTVIFPKHQTCCTYLSRMRFHEQLSAQGVKVKGSRTVREVEPGRLLECHEFDTRSFEALCDSVTGRMLAFKYHPNAVLDLKDAMLEIGANVEEHAHTFGGFLAAQTFKVGTAQEYMVFAIGDVGVGIRQSLESGRVPTDSDIEAIEYALQPGVSSVKDKVRGFGFEHMTEAITGLRGELYVRSAAGKVIVSPSGTKSQAVGTLGGTIVAARVPCANWRKLKGVDGYA